MYVLVYCIKCYAFDLLYLYMNLNLLPVVVVLMVMAIMMLVVVTDCGVGETVANYICLRRAVKYHYHSSFVWLTMYDLLVGSPY